ncbi:MAG TPA: heparinase, partial [Novosphingobium sp.]|nr:heparinase [Novosphingobium sp.]
MGPRLDAEAEDGAPGDGPAIPLARAQQSELALDEAQPAPARGKPARPGQLIEPGRALALADFAPPSLGATDRLIRFAYRMGLRGGLSLRKPARPRLLATVTSPIAGDRAAGTALRAGHFLVHGAKFPIAQVDFAGVGRLAPPVERLVHGFRWLA